MRWLHKRSFTRSSPFQTRLQDNSNKIQQATSTADSKATQQINFTGNLDWDGNTTMSFIIEEAKETILDFSQRTVTALI